MWLKLRDFLSLNAPDVDDSILAARDYVLGVGGEWTLNDGWFVEETGKFVLFCPMVGIQQHNHIVGCGYEKQIPIAAKFHYFDFAVFIQWPIPKRSSLTLFDTE